MKLPFWNLMPVTVALSLAVCAAPASAAAIQWSGNGNYYEFFGDKGTYFDAFSKAEGATRLDLPGYVGHLVTITSAGEQSFVDSLFAGKTPAQFIYWMAASDTGSEGTWRWTAGPELGQSFADTGFENWRSGEPNTFQGNEEDYLLGNWIGLGEWNDISPFRSEGYIVEYALAAQPVPAPALLPGLIGFGMSILRKKKGEAQAA